MNFLSVCSGIEAASVAWHPLGWRAFAYSEVDAFPSAVLKHHYPETPNLGDMTKFKEWPDATIDLLVGGTPCQSFSVAGLRKGLADPRGNLMLTYLAIADRYRPKWLVWENVPGVLSSNGGKDFGAFLGGLAQLGYGFAYRVLDAQYFGVAQRRRRVFVVGYLGDWRRAAAVLFERHSLQGHPAPRREAGESVAPCPGDCADRGGTNSEGQRLIAQPHADISPAIKARDSKGVSSDGDGDGAILVPMVPIAFDTTQITSKANGSNPKQGNPCHPLAAGAHAPAIAFPANLSGTQVATSEDLCPSMGAKNPTAVAFSIMPMNSGKDYRARETRIAQPLMAGGPVGGNQGGDFITSAMQVRRLTPRECCRLQQFPDDYLETHYADADEAHAAQILHELWRGTGAKGIATEEAHIKENRSGDVCEKHRIASSLLTPEILLAGVHVGWIQWSQAEQYAKRKNLSLVGEGGWTEGFVRGLWEARKNGCSPYKRESFGQLARELGMPLSELSLETTQARAFVRSSKLWSEAQRAWPLRYALATRLQVEKGRMNPDGPRYKALGNSMAVPVMRWIGERVQAVDLLPANRY